MTAKAKKQRKQNKLAAFLTSPQLRGLVGIMLIFVSIYILLSLISFFFTGAEDQSFVANHADASIHATNWAGNMGANIAEALINRSFGVASFALVFLTIVLSCLLLNISVKSQLKCLVYPLLILAWLPVFLSLCFDSMLNDSYLNIGGDYGQWMSATLGTSLGLAGEIIVLILTFILFGFFAFGWSNYFDGRSFTLPSLSFLRPRKKPESDPADDFITAEPVEEEPVTEPEPVVPMRETEVDGVTIVSSDGSDDQPAADPAADTAETTDDGVPIISVEPDPEEEISIELPDDDTAPADDDNVIDVTEDKEDDPMDSNNSRPGETPEELLARVGPYDPTRELSTFRFPSPELLRDFSDQKAGVSQEEQLANQQKIISTLRNFNIGVKKIVETIGPTVTLFEIVPDDGVRIAKIRNLEKDIMLSLSATGIRLIAPMPGKGTIGIEVPNAHPRTVGMRPLITSQKFSESTAELPVVMGRTITNGIFMFDLAKTPHLIVAGATGQGKSVGLNAIITSLLYRKHPSQVKFVLIDPKQLEFSMYRDIERHYLAKLPDADEAVITDSKKVVETLEAICREMDNRYYLLSVAKVRNIVEYNKKFTERRLNPIYGHHYLPYIVVIVDEFGDLIATEGKKVEAPIQRITQKARAAGIHMVLATQRPSVNVITGVIKANCPTRIAFRVISKIDSMTILDCAGADQLIGRGDMLYSKGDVPERVQCAFVDTPEVEAIVEHIHSQQAYPEAYMLPEPDASEGEEGGEADFSIRHADKLFNEVAEYVVLSQLGSASNLQRKFEIGFNRAGKLMDQLEAAGIVGPARGSKPRDVLIKTLDQLQELILTLQ